MTPRKTRARRNHHTPEFREEALRAVDRQPERTIADIVRRDAYCGDLVGGPFLETNDDVVRAFRPKK